MLASAAAPVAEEPVEEKAEEPVDVTDPDDIDALLASASEQGSDQTSDAPAEEKVEEPVEDVDVTDPDDIDALLASMSDNAPTPKQADVTEPENQAKSDMAVAEQDIEDKAMAQDSELSAEELQIQKEIAENEAKIAEFTAEYVTPFLTADFSDILAKQNEAELATEEPASNDSAEVDDELDIDALIADTQSEDEVVENEQAATQEDIGDSLTDYVADEVSNEQSDESLTESALTQLLAEEALDETAEQSDEQTEVSPFKGIELAPDFSDEEVLADLLAETAELEEEESIENADALDIIEELDNVDFDELLANIEEESAPSTSTDDEVELILDDIGDDLTEKSLGEESLPSVKATEATPDYVSVDDLLSDTFDEVGTAEPYEKTNIDVGLGQFAENDSGIDVDKDGSMSSKLDLAKMYIEMSDEENAQVILQEVMVKGDASQQVEAKALLDSL